MAQQKKHWGPVTDGVRWKHRNQGPKGTGRAPMEPERRGKPRETRSERHVPALTQSLGDKLRAVLDDDDRAAVMVNTDAPRSSPS